MSQEMDQAQDDIFGKIDALLGKRVGFSGAANKKDDWDFPLLTDVVGGETKDEVPVELAWHATPSVQEEVRTTHYGAEPVVETPLPTLEWEAPAFHETTVAPLEDNNPVPVLETIEIPPVHEPPVSSDEELRFSEILIEHEARLEARMRQIIREELERLLGRP